MRKVLFVLVLLIVGVVALGFYQGWFGFSSARDPDTGKTGTQFNFDQTKMKEDVQKAKQKITGSASQTKDESESK